MWRARLSLEFERRGERTALAARRHEGPLVVQKPLYPEAPHVCHAIVVHPPGGIAGGDDLGIDVRLGEKAHALFTTPGATKWYRSAGAGARQAVAIELASGAACEWLPQETIVFDGALADIAWDAHLAPDARLFAWEIVCLGRRGSGEHFTRGHCRLAMRVVRGTRPVYVERGVIPPRSVATESPAGLAASSVVGTFLAAFPPGLDVPLGECRAIEARDGEGAMTQLPGLIVGRFRGESGAAAREYFTGLWRVLRASVLGLEAVPPRIWST